jgi:hypothetical protein
MAAVVCRIGSVQRMDWPFQKEVLSSVILTPMLPSESAGFLYEGEKLIYAMTADGPCYMNENGMRILREILPKI